MSVKRPQIRPNGFASAHNLNWASRFLPSHLEFGSAGSRPVPRKRKAELFKSGFPKAAGGVGWVLQECRPSFRQVPRGGGHLRAASLGGDGDIVWTARRCNWTGRPLSHTVWPCSFWVGPRCSRSVPDTQVTRGGERPRGPRYRSGLLLF